MGMIGNVKALVTRAVTWWGEYNASPATLADGDVAPPQMDSHGSLRTVPPVAAIYETEALQVSGVASNAPATLLELRIFNNSGSDRYFQLFDATAVPADGAVPVTCPIKVAAGAQEFGLAFGPDGRPFTAGISWASSSTRNTKTVTGVADMWVSATLRKP